MRMNRFRQTFLALALIVLGSCSTSGNMRSDQYQLAEKSRVTMQNMLADTQYPGLLDLATRAKAIIIAPNILQAAFFFGGRGGNAVMLARGPDGKWSDPAFYTIGGLSWGLQI